MVNVQLAIISNKHQDTLSMTFSSGTSMKQALQSIELSKYHLPALDEFDEQGYAVGIYAKKVTMDTILKDGDRIEVYWPLKQSAMAARRARIQAKKRETSKDIS